MRLRAIHGRITRVAGVDEAGRGPLAGPVVAAAVLLDPARPVRGVRDSKLLAPERRRQLAERIRERATGWAVAWADPEEIDTLNILQASLLAMRRALQRLAVLPEHVQVDGNRCPSLAGTGLGCTIEAVVHGDDSIAAISAASILAKVYRDGLMERLHELYPDYGFAAHKGYPTPAHAAALQRFGPSPIHRRTFTPVRLQLRKGGRVAVSARGPLANGPGRALP